MKALIIYSIGLPFFVVLNGMVFDLPRFGDFKSNYVEKNHTLDYQLFQAVIDDDKLKVQYLLWHGVDITAKASHDIKIKEIRKDSSRPKSYYISSGQTPLQIAIDMNHEELIKMLILNGADIEMADKDGRTPMDYALKFREIRPPYSKLNYELIEDLLKRKACLDPNLPYATAIRRNDEELVKLLIKHRSWGINMQNEFGLTPLHFAASIGNNKLVKILIKAGARFNIKTFNNRVDGAQTALEIAEQQGHDSTVKLMHSLIDEQKKFLFISLENGDEITVKKLLPKFHLTMVDKDGNTVLHHAVKGGNKNLAGMIYALKPNLIAKTNKAGETAVSYAVGHYSLLKLFFSLSAAKELLQASKKGDIAKVKKLLDHGISVNMQNESGYTSLHLDTIMGHDHIKRLLIKAGADQTIITNNGKTAAVLAKKSFFNRQIQKIKLAIKK